MILHYLEWVSKTIFLNNLPGKAPIIVITNKFLDFRQKLH